MHVLFLDDVLYIILSRNDNKDIRQSDLPRC